MTQELNQCPRCLSLDIVEVHGHYQCRCGFYVSECCQGECEQIIQTKQADPLDRLIENCNALLIKQRRGRYF